MAVTPDWIVEHYDVVTHILEGQRAGYINALPNAFLLQAREEGFGDRVIPGAASRPALADPAGHAQKR